MNNSQSATTSAQATVYSRIIRRGYYEHPDYVPFVDRAYELWRELEGKVGERLLEITGIIEMGATSSPLLKGSLLSCQLHSIPHELLSAAQIMTRFPQFVVPDWMRGVWQKDAGILAVEPLHSRVPVRREKCWRHAS